jgi:single-stranded-DNA-specific exonuclease
VRDAIYAKVGQVAANEEFRHTLWGIVYKFTTNGVTGPLDLREYSAILDACGRLRKPEIGFAAALGDRAAYNEARGLISRYLEQMVRTLGKLDTRVEAFKVTPRMRYIYTADEIEPTVIGEAISLAMESGLIATDRPVIWIADGDGKGDVKISARATPGLAMHGLNMGGVLSKVAFEIGGSGGGHDVAAAARIPRERMDEFIAKLDQALTEVGGA